MLSKWLIHLPVVMAVDLVDYSLKLRAQFGKLLIRVLDSECFNQQSPNSGELSFTTRLFATALRCRHSCTPEQNNANCWKAMTFFERLDNTNFNGF